MNRQRGFAWLALLPYALGALAIGGTLFGAWRAVNGWCNSACREQAELVIDATARAVTAEGLILAAQERATALALLWAKSIEQVEKIYVDRTVIRADAFAGLRQRAGAITVGDAGCVVQLAADTSRVLDDASRLANNAPADPGVDQVAAEAVPEPAREVDAGELTQKWIEAAESYADAKAKLDAMIKFYEALRTAQAQQEAAPGG